VIDHPSFEGWYLEGSWIITGETRSYTTSSLNNETGGFQAPVPSKPFALGTDSWGAWELVARYSSTDLNWNPSQLQTTSQLAGVLGGKEDIFDIGVNWYMNRNIKLQVHDSFITVEKGTAAIPNRDGQDINVVGVRLQYSN
jgi:phosphate-selective porin OprO/OprP